MPLLLSKGLNENLPPFPSTQEQLHEQVTCAVVQDPTLRKIPFLGVECPEVAILKFLLYLSICVLLWDSGFGSGNLEPLSSLLLPPPCDKFLANLYPIPWHRKPPVSTVQLPRPPGPGSEYTGRRVGSSQAHAPWGISGRSRPKGSGKSLPRAEGSTSLR